MIIFIWYIRGVIVLKHFHEYGIKITSNASIIPKGIEYLEENNILKSTLIEYFKAKDIEIKDGKSKDSVIIDLKIKPLDSVEKIYINVNLG